MRFRLSLLMFLQYATPAALVQLYSLHLKQLGMHPLLVGLCCATQSLATLLTAFFVGQAADRWFSAERCLAVCSLVASLALALLPELTEFWSIFGVTFLFWLMVAPVLMLGTTICFTHLPSPEKQFGSVRMWGTVGWMVPAWLLFGLLTVIGAGRESGYSTLFRMGSVFALALGFYALTIPHTPPRPSTNARPAPLLALARLRGPSFNVYCLCMFGACMTYPFSTQATPILLEQLGVPRQWISPTLTLSQTTEVLSLALMPTLLRCFRLRGLLLVGLGAWTVALLILAIGQPLNLIIGSLALNGLFITGFLVAGQVYVNSQTSGPLRASAQSLLTFVNGTGMFLGNLLIGYLRWIHDDNFGQVFGIAALVTAGLLVLLFLGFYQPLQAPVIAPATPRIEPGQQVA